MASDDSESTDVKENPHFTYNLSYRKLPERKVSNPLKQIAKVKKLLNRIKDNTENLYSEPSNLVMDPSMYGNRAYGVLFFFLEMSEYDGYENTVDLSQLNSLFERGADIDATDNIGQTILHDCARIHKMSTAKYFIRLGVDVNKQDIYGRTALHIAAKKDYEQMVELLIENGANTEFITNGACFSALHCAAMGNAAAAISVLVKFSANKETTDYRGRTPMLIAAEYDRTCAAQKLIELGVTTRVVDYTGLHALSLLISKMPKLACTALDQCFSLDTKSRELKVWINYLEPDLLVPKDARYGFTVLDEVSKSADSELVQNPAIKALISTKWKQFGQRAVIKDIALYLIYLVSWSLLMILTPLAPPSDEGDFKESRGSRRIITETVAYIFYIYFVLEEIREARCGHLQQRRWKNMRIGQIQSDLKIIRPLSEMDKQFLNSEMERTDKAKSQYLKDSWNYFDWTVYILQLVGIGFYLYCEIACLKMDFNNEEERKSYFKTFRIRSQLMAIAILLSWFKVFKYLRVFKSMGPFVVIITHSFGDVGKIAIVYMLLYIPMVCIFYQFYQGVQGFEDVSSVMFTVFRMIVVDDYNYDSLVETSVDHSYDASETGDRVARRRGNTGGNSDSTDENQRSSELVVDLWWTRFLVAYWILVSSVILLNLFIALMSDTFQRVYDNAKGVAALEKAEIIAELEGKLTKKSRDRYLKDLEDNYSPLCEFVEKDEGEKTCEEMAKLENIEGRIEQLERLIVSLNEDQKKLTKETQEENVNMFGMLDSKIQEMHTRDRTL